MSRSLMIVLLLFLALASAIVVRQLSRESSIQSSPTHVPEVVVVHPGDAEAISSVADLIDATLSQAAQLQRASKAGNDREPSQGPAHQVETDAQWRLLPREDLTIMELMTEKSQVDSRRLYRNKQLNPGDVYVAPDIRETLALLLEPYNQGLEQAKQIEVVSVGREFQELIASGKSRYQTMGQVTDRLSPAERQELDAARAHVRKAMRARGHDSDASNMVVPDLMFKDQGPQHIHSVRDGKIFSATLAELPKTLTVVEARDYLMIEATNAIADWFIGNGCLDKAGKEQQMMATMCFLRSRQRVANTKEVR